MHLLIWVISHKVILINIFLNYVKWLTIILWDKNFYLNRLNVEILSLNIITVRRISPIYDLDIFFLMSFSFQIFCCLNQIFNSSLILLHNHVQINIQRVPILNQVINFQKFIVTRINTNKLGIWAQRSCKGLDYWNFLGNLGPNKRGIILDFRPSRPESPLWSRTSSTT